MLCLVSDSVFFFLFEIYNSPFFLTSLDEFIFVFIIELVVITVLAKLSFKALSSVLHCQITKRKKNDKKYRAYMSISIKSV